MFGLTKKTTVIDHPSDRVDDKPTVIREFHTETYRSFADRAGIGCASSVKAMYDGIDRQIQLVTESIMNLRQQQAGLEAARALLLIAIGDEPTG